jgi:glutathione S-transferase
MRLLYSPTSPFVRKVLITAHEIGVADRIETVRANPREPTAMLLERNPLGKIPVLLTDDGGCIYDSPLICDYLDSTFGGHALLPRAGLPRFEALTRVALGDGLVDAAILYRAEISRPEEKLFSQAIDWQLRKVNNMLTRLETMVPSFGEKIDLGQIAFGCALGWLEFRLADKKMLAGVPKVQAWFSAISQRPSFQATVPRLD